MRTCRELVLCESYVVACCFFTLLATMTAPGMFFLWFSWFLLCVRLNTVNLFSVCSTYL